MTRVLMRFSLTIAAATAVALVGSSLPARAEPASRNPLEASSSSSQPGYEARGAVDADRFGTSPGHAWQGHTGETSWWWQVQFDQPTPIGAILQIVGSDPHTLKNAPSQYVWQASDDGATWHDLPGTQVEAESRLFRVHRMAAPHKCRYLRMQIDAVHGKFPTLREIEIFPSADAEVGMADWALVVKSESLRPMPTQSQLFTDLARACRGWEDLQLQYVSLESFNESFLAAEPKPLCAFMTGSLSEWCEQPREPWRGAQKILENGHLPIWASCGGAQGLALLAEVGVDQPWDCPRCRDPANPKSPIYTHIGHTGEEPCGRYKKCLWERGPTYVRLTADDPAFEGLPNEFRVMESHCGQVEYVPKGWTLVATQGKDGKTPMQCMRLDRRPIYAAQFHIEMKGTPEVSKIVMSNFLKLARQWGGYNPAAKLLPPPTPLPGAPTLGAR